MGALKQAGYMVGTQFGLRMLGRIATQAFVSLRARLGNGVVQATTRLFGHNEYAVANATQVARVRQGLEAFYRRNAPTGSQIRWVDNVPGGRNGYVDTITGDIFLSNDLLRRYPHLAEGVLLEELQHFHQLFSLHWLGRSLSGAEESILEREVVRRMLRSGFRVFDPRRP